MAIKHLKTNTVPPWTQANLDAAIAKGTVPPGTTLDGFVLSTDWNDDHQIDLTDIIQTTGNAYSYGTGLPGDPFTIGANDNPTYPGGNEGNIQFNQYGSFSGTDSLFWDYNNNRLGVGTNAPQAVVDIRTVDPARIGQIIKAATSQSADLLQFINSSGSILNRVTAAGLDINSVPSSTNRSLLFQSSWTDGPSGTVRASIAHDNVGTDLVLTEPSSANRLTMSCAPGGSQYNSLYNLSITTNSGQMYLSVGFAFDITMTANGTYFRNGNDSPRARFIGVAGQTTNLIEFQNSSGSILSAVTANGNITLTQAGAIFQAGTTGLFSGRYFTFSDNTGPYLSSLTTGMGVINRNNASNVPFYVQGMAAQSGNLTEWRNSAGGILASIGASGILTTKGQVVGTRVVTASGAVTVTADDYYIGINKTTGAATTVNLPASPATGTTFIIKDEKCDAATNNITVTPAAGNIISSSSGATYVMNANGQSATLIYSGSAWSVN